MKLRPHYVQVIVDEFRRIQGANPRYSLRAFAGRLKIQPSELSRLISLKKSLSVSMSLTILRKLNLSTEETRLFLQSVLEERGRDEFAKVARVEPALEFSPEILDAESCAQVFNLTAHGILQLALTDDFRSDPAWIAARLGISQPEIEESLRALTKLGLIKCVDGHFVNSHKNFTALSTEAMDRVQKAHQLSLLDKAVQCLEKVPFERRSNMGVTMSIDPAKIPEARQRIYKFLTELNDFLESGSRKEVYQIALQLFPLSGEG